MDETLRVAKDLLNTIKTLQRQEAMQLRRHMSALKMLSEISHDKTVNLETILGRVQ